MDRFGCRSNEDMNRRFGSQWPNQAKLLAVISMGLSSLYRVVVQVLSLGKVKQSRVPVWCVSS